MGIFSIKPWRWDDPRVAQPLPAMRQPTDKDLEAAGGLATVDGHPEVPVLGADRGMAGTRKFGLVVMCSVLMGLLLLPAVYMHVRMIWDMKQELYMLKQEVKDLRSSYEELLSQVERIKARRFVSKVGCYKQVYLFYQTDYLPAQ